MKKARILICDDDEIFHFRIRSLLAKNSEYEVLSCWNGDEALKIVSTQPIDILLLDIQLRSSNEGLNTITPLLKADPDLSIVMSSHIQDLQIVREAIRNGATDYLVKSLGSEEVLLTLDRIMEKRSFRQREEQHRCESTQTHQNYVLIGNSKPIRNLRRTLEKVRQSSATVMITGETGTGKELVARQLRDSQNGISLLNAPFIAIDSSTIQSSTAESILFGHEKGSFTGAERTTKGVFEEAHGGIVYFDEISNMPLSIQSKLLRVLQQKEITRVGSSKVISLQFRVICATNQPLEQLAQEGLFKFDLLQRLSVIPIELAPLRERLEDIPLLIQAFLEKHAPKLGPIEFTAETMQTLYSYSWPGNIRELENLIIYLSMMLDEPRVKVSELPAKFLKNPISVSQPTTFYERMAQYEAQVLREEYAHHHGKISHLSASLKMDRSHLYSKLKEYGIHQKRKISPFENSHSLM